MKLAKLVSVMGYTLIAIGLVIVVVGSEAWFRSGLAWALIGTITAASGDSLRRQL